MAEQPTLAERLGFQTTDRILIVHADDMGMCHSANAASIEALNMGEVTCGSIMVPCPWFPEIAAWAAEHPTADLGIHLTVTSEWRHYRWGPVAPRNSVVTLVDPDGFLWRSNGEVQAHAQPEEVETELRAQIARARQFGVEPTHLDIHMGTLFHPAFFPVYLRVSEESGILPMLVTPEGSRRHGVFAAYESLAGELVDHGFLLLDEVIVGVKRTGTLEERRQRFYETLRWLKPGVTKLILHLAGDDPEIRSITDSWQLRYHEYLIFTDPQTRELMEAESIKLIGYRRLAELWRAATGNSAGH